MLANYAKKIIYYCGIYLFFASQFALGQDCQDMLRRAESAYKYEHLHEVKTILIEDCIKLLPTKEQKIEAYYMLVLSNLYLGDKAEAQKNMLAIISIDPEYKFSKNNPVEFQKFYDTFEIRPHFFLGGGIGANTSRISLEKPYSLDNINNVKQNTSYKAEVRFEIYAIASWAFSKKLEILTNPSFRSVGYNYNTQVFKNQNLSFDELIWFASMPLLLKYNFSNLYDFSRDRTKFFNTLNTYVVAGISADWIISSTGVAKRTDELSTFPFQAQSGSINLNSQRNRMSYWAVGGVGLEYKKKKSTFGIELRYRQNLTNLIRDENRYNNQDLMFNFGYIDNDWKMQNFSILIHYIYPFYKSKIKKTKEKD